MDCEFEICIYNDDGKCDASEIAISAAGYCESCIIVDIEKDELKKRKAKMLKRLDEQWSKCRSD